MNIKLNILQEGKHHLVVFKPSNTIVVKGRGIKTPTILDLAQKKFGKAICPVHRLDRGTTGCLILAKDPYGQQALSDAFRKRRVKKTYLAIVEGEPKFKKFSCDARLIRVDTPSNKKSQAHQIVSEDPGEGERALTHFRVLSPLSKGGQGGFFLIEARPVTGKMHQIRAHLAYLGFPILGDWLYGSKIPYAPHVIALHAYKLEFPAPEGGLVKVQAQPEKLFLECLPKGTI